MPTIAARSPCWPASDPSRPDRSRRPTPPMDVIDNPQQLAAVDIAIVLVYMAGVFVLGSFFGRYVKSAGDFFVAGRALPFWAIGMSVVVSDIGATDFIATAGAGYTYGVAAANFDWMGSM